MENTEIKDIELEQLRREYALLKQKVDSQEVISDKLMKATLKAKMNKISSKVWIETVLTAAVMIMAPIAFHNQDFFCFSWWFVAATEIMVAACMGMTWAWHLKVRNPDDSSCSMLEFAKSVKELKTKYQKWTSKCLMVIIPWGIWLVVEIFCHSENHAQALIFSAYCIVCGIIGGLIGLKMNKKVMAECDGIIRQIEE